MKLKEPIMGSSCSNMNVERKKLQSVEENQEGKAIQGRKGKFLLTLFISQEGKG
jgi:hypothetical protein